jgi:hypothetical protein
MFVDLDAEPRTIGNRNPNLADHWFGRALTRSPKKANAGGVPALDPRVREFALILHFREIDGDERLHQLSSSGAVAGVGTAALAGRVGVSRQRRQHHASAGPYSMPPGHGPAREYADRLSGTRNCPGRGPVQAARTELTRSQARFTWPAHTLRDKARCGLHLVPLQIERYDSVLRRASLDLAAAQSLPTCSKAVSAASWTCGQGTILRTQARWLIQFNTTGATHRARGRPLHT